MAAQESIIRPADVSAVMEREKIELIKATVAKGTTDEELRLFLYTAQRTGLDPLTRQIHAIKRYNRKENREVMTIQTGIDGYRVVAERTGKLAGSDDPIYDSESGLHPGKASVTVYKMIDGQRCPFTASARWSEYVQTFPDGKPMGLWVKMPYLMLGKCAEALALRKAFPADLSGVYTFEEMSQADSAVTTSPTQEPTEHYDAADDTKPVPSVAARQQAAPAAAPPAQQQQRRPTGRTISEAQQKRFWAIAKGNNLGKDDMVRVVRQFGFNGIAQITMDKYEAVCEALKRPAHSDEVQDDDIPF
jgi:phage recombination protein Bet